ncbi:MAG: dihydropteroate synthase [Melioribacteraceae bacterium]|nr:dihydropteroate synthase [Melioribacteraceae bacterium]
MADIYHKIKHNRTPVIMGILNVTPDSFSDGGKYFNKEDAINHALNLYSDGADIIDIGGESTRPGSESISLDEELSRVVPIIKELHSANPSIIISIDTTKSEVAREAIKNGASIINDISGGIFDEKIFGVAANDDVPLIIMHIKGKPKFMQNSPSYDNVIEEISEYFEDRIELALKYDVKKIILDPGIGFGKRIEDNYKIIKQLKKINKWDYPLLVGVSRKSFLGKSLSIKVENRDNATIIAETISVLNGANIIRTHNVQNAVELKKMISYLT